MSSRTAAEAKLRDAIRTYWDANVDRWAIAEHPVGSREFFEEIEAYRFDKLQYLPLRVRFDGWADRQVLDVGCGLGNDLSRFARGGATVTGIDLSTRAIDLARKNFALRGLEGSFHVMDGEAIGLPDASFDLVYCHTVLHFTANPARMVREVHRVLRRGGVAILMTVNRHSWMNWMRKVMKTEIDHLDAPVLQHMSPGEFRALLVPFDSVELVAERFPVPTRVHHGINAGLFNHVFVPAFRLLPASLVQHTGHHLLAICRKV